MAPPPPTSEFKTTDQASLPGGDDSKAWSAYQKVSTMAPPPALEFETIDHEPLPDEAPDGGSRAWLVVLGSWCCNFVVSGWLNGIGVFQDYYSTALFPDLPTSTIAIVSSLVAMIIFAGVSRPRSDQKGVALC